MPVRGIARVTRITRRTAERIAGPTTERAVYALLSQGAAIAATMTPVDTSTLINSQYAPQIQQRRGRTTGHVGYTADYAKHVHDMPGTLKGLPRADFGMTGAGIGFGGGTGKGHYWDPGAEPGFLEKGMNEIKKQGPAILRKLYRVR